ncbi:MAG: hypothetical protein ACPGLY_27980, partial [Rubripirellula sp.]
DPKIGVKEKALIWLTHQGVSTVLLFLILYVIWTAWPQAVAKIQEGYDKNASQLEKAFETQSKTVDKILEYAEKRDNG